jgi:hypothetical protein|nr:MAG TPA: HOLLIDAY JUNCTION RESOLVASE junction resolvase, HJC, HYDROLASE [Caudoviricetes sp.]
MKRSGKFYRRNEAEIMQILGMKPTKNSGSGWIEKEDGQNDNVICQLKSTDANSIKINKKDIDTLNYNASVSHKLPVFAIQFLQSNEVYLLLKPENLSEVIEYINTGEVKNNNLFEIENVEDVKAVNVSKQLVKSCSDAREQFKKEQERKYKKERRSAK